MVVKKTKMTKLLIATIFLLTIITLVTTANACAFNRILVIARGDDGDISGATTSIIAMIEYDKDSDIPSVADCSFLTKLYDESGEKIYSMMGILKDALVISDKFQFYCSVRKVTWINLLFIMGEGKLKTTDAELEIEYRGQDITLPNTKGRYLSYSYWVMINPKVEYVLGEDPQVHVWPEGGWATVIITIDEIPTVGVVTYLTRYIQI
jgi:hypothetical protein